MKEKVLQALKPKTASLGFNKEEIESAAEHIAGTLEQDATEEQINAQIDAVIPFLQVSQKAVTRIVNEKKKPEKKAQPPAPTVSTPTETEEQGADDKLSSLIKLIEAQGKQIETLINKETASKQYQVYEAKLKDLPETLRKSKLKDFSRMSLNQEEFEEFIEEQTEDIAQLVKDFGSNEVNSMGRPILGGKTTDKQASDKEITEVINQLNI